MSRPTSIEFESSYPPAEAPARLWLALAVGLSLLALAWAGLHLPFFDRFQIIDTPVYQEYGERIVGGEVPYRDFEVEYPPAALPVFWLPTLTADEHYDSAFGLLMAACAAATLGFALLALVGVGAPPPRLLATAVFVAVAPLALGSVVLTRYDFWPAALTAAFLAALVWGRERLGFALLALAAAAKIYPLVFVPVALVYAGRRKGAREAGIGLIVFLAVLLLVAGPFLVVAPDGVVSSVTAQLGRPLQIESLGAAALLAFHQLGWYEATVVSSHGSQNLAGALPDALATVQTVLGGLALLVVWTLHARAPGGRERLLLAGAAAAAAFVALGKVLSPQFLIWLIPIVPLVVGPTGLAAAGVLGVALLATHLWFPSRYWDVVALQPAGWLVLVRDFLLLALVAALVRALATREPEAPRSA